MYVILDQDMTLWTFVSESGRDMLADWAGELRLPTRVRAAIDQKADVLRQQPFEILIHTNLLAGPIAKQRHIYKLRVNGDIAVRLMLCKGPLERDDGYTILLGAVERDGKLVPADAPERASLNRELVLKSPRERRKFYERLGKANH
jgi:hypothetical protein